MKKIKSVSLWAVTIIVCAVIACALTVELFPQPQFTVDLGDFQNQNVTVYTYHNQGTPFSAVLVGPNTYACDIPQGYWEHAYHLEFTIDPVSYHILSANINWKTVREGQIVHIDSIITSPPYQTTVVIHASETTAESAIIFCAILTILLVICLIIRHEIVVSGFGTLRKTLLCGGSALPAIGKKGFLWALAGVLLSCVVSVGCDINMIVCDMSLVGRGANLYQYMATMDRPNGVLFLLWPYNLPMTIAYFLGTFPLQLGQFAYDRYNIICYLYYKLLHGGLILVTVVSILSFLEKRGMVAREKCMSAFLWSFFNPLVFYVAVVFIQLDIFPACCLVLGCLLFAEQKTPLLSGVLLGIGASCKMQCFLLIPTIVVALLCGVLQNKKAEKTVAWKTTVAFIFTLVLFVVPMMISDLPISLMGQYNPQADRVWWTTLEYTADTFLLVTPGILIYAMISNLVHLNLQKRLDTLAINSLYMFGAVVLLFSFSIQSTPSTLIHCLAAFTLLNVESKDHLQRLMVGGLSVLMAFEVMFNTYGDIAGLLKYIGIPYNFTLLVQHHFGTDQWTRFNSLLFTISHAAMLAYGILFCKKAIDALKSDDGNGCRLMSDAEK